MGGQGFGNGEKGRRAQINHAGGIGFDCGGRGVLDDVIEKAPGIGGLEVWIV